MTFELSRVLIHVLPGSLRTLMASRSKRSRYGGHREGTTGQTRKKADGEFTKSALVETFSLLLRLLSKRSNRSQEEEMVRGSK